jgi:hypothetical protein
MLYSIPRSALLVQRGPQPSFLKSLSQWPRISGLQTFSVHSPGSTSSMVTETAPSLFPVLNMTALVTSAAILAFYSDLPDRSLPITSGMILSSVQSATDPDRAG